MQASHPHSKRRKTRTQKRFGIRSQSRWERQPIPVSSSCPTAWVVVRRRLRDFSATPRHWLVIVRPFRSARSERHIILFAPGISFLLLHSTALATHTRERELGLLSLWPTVDPVFSAYQEEIYNQMSRVATGTSSDSPRLPNNVQVALHCTPHTLRGSPATEACAACGCMAMLNILLLLCPAQLKFGRPSNAIGSSTAYPNTDSIFGGDNLDPSKAVFLQLQFAVGEERAS